jgi:hypothetical protein
MQRSLYNSSSDNISKQTGNVRQDIINKFKGSLSGYLPEILTGSSLRKRIIRANIVKEMVVKCHNKTMLWVISSDIDSQLGERDFSLLRNVQIGSGAQPASY